MSKRAVSVNFTIASECQGLALWVYRLDVLRVVDLQTYAVRTCVEACAYEHVVVTDLSHCTCAACFSI